MTGRPDEKILLAHGGGGRLTQKLIENNILPKFKNDILAQLGDSANLDLPSGRICFTTDSYVVKPLFFNGGDIGKLAVCGTINDLAVAGAKPVALSLSVIIEEGLEFKTLEKILSSVARAAEKNNVPIVTGDTKVVEKGAADKIFINTAGVGIRIAKKDMSFEGIDIGDQIIINGSIADHGMTILSQREGIKFQSKLKSDCAALAGLISQVLEKVNGVKFMRDPTRGGLAATLNEIANKSDKSIEIVEKDIPVKAAVRAAADMLGFDVLDIANEGKFVAVVSPDCVQDCLKICRQHLLGKQARLIGRVTEANLAPLVELITEIGGRRIVQMPYGRELPRIC